MLDSQVLETLLGLALMFFVIALASSSIVEIVSQVFKKRATHLETAIAQMLAGSPRRLSDLSPAQRSAAGLPADAPAGEADRDLDAGELKLLDASTDSSLQDALGAFRGTSVYEAAVAGSRRARPSYLSARAFAEGVGEMLDSGHGLMKSVDSLPQGLQRRLKALTRQPTADIESKLLAIKSGLEQWFDETMDRLEGAYKRWTKWWLFGLGLTIAVAGNASTFTTAERLWHDPATRQAVANAADKVAAEGDPAALKSVAAATDRLEELGIPVGWNDAAREVWSNPLGAVTSWAGWAMVLGWLVTASLVMLGAPFWFDLLTRLASLRSTGAKPVPANDDPASATSLRTAIPRTLGPTVAPPGPPAPRSGPPTRSSVDDELARAFGLQSAGTL